MGIKPSTTLRKNTGRENSRKRKMDWKVKPSSNKDEKKRGSEITESRFFSFVYGFAAGAALAFQRTLPLL